MLLLAPPVNAALIDTYFLDSEEELDYLFQSGEIDLEQYRLLEEFFSVLPYTVQGTHITASNGTILYADSTAVQELSSASISENFPYFQWLTDIKTSVTYKMYHDLDADEARRQLLNISGKPAKSFSYYFEAEKKPDYRQYYFRKRLVKFSYRNLNAEIGNFNPSWGMGITMGYYSDFLAKDDSPAYRSFLFPAKGRLNGIRLQYDSKISPIAILSYDCSETASGRMAGFGFDYSVHSLSMGLLGSYHKIENLTNDKDYSNFIIGGNIKLKSGPYAVQSEISESKGEFFAWSSALVRKLDKGRFTLAAWNYPLGYLNPYGEGKANSDFTTTEIPDTELEFRSRQYGEWGILSQSRYLLFENHLTSIAANYWRDGGQEEKFRVKICDQLAVTSSLNIALTYLWGDDNLNDDYGLRQHLRFDVLYGKSPRNRMRFSTELKRICYSYGRRDIARFELRAAYPISERINSVVKFSRVDYDMSDGAPGYWLIYLSEDITFGKYLFLRAVVDTREGENYNLINSARFNLQITLMAE